MLEHWVVRIFFSPLVVTESSIQRRRSISVEYVMETTHPAGDLPEHLTRQGLVRFADMLPDNLALRYVLRVDYDRFNPFSLS